MVDGIKHQFSQRRKFRCRYIPKYRYRKIKTGIRYIWSSFENMHLLNIIFPDIDIFMFLVWFQRTVSKSLVILTRNIYLLWFAVPDFALWNFDDWNLSVVNLSSTWRQNYFFLIFKSSSTERTYKKVLWKYAVNLQENTRAKVWFQQSCEAPFRKSTYGGLLLFNILFSLQKIQQIHTPNKPNKTLVFCVLIVMINIIQLPVNSWNPSILKISPTSNLPRSCQSIV